MSYIRLLRQRVPLTLWLGQVVSEAGDRLYSMAMLWLALQLTGSAAAMAVMAIAQSLTLTVVGLVAGAVVDRVNRLHVAIMVDGMRAVVVLAIPVAHILGALNIDLLIVTGTIMGALDGIFSPAFESVLPSLVSRDAFHSLAGLMDTPSRFARLFGSGSAGVLLGILSVEGFFWLDAVSFGISTLSLGLVTWWRRHDDGVVVPAIRRDRHLWSDVKAGVQTVLSDSRTLSIFIVDGVGNVAFAAFTLGGLLLAVRELHVGLGGYGELIAAYGVGSLVGNGIAGNLPLARFRFILSVSGWLGIGCGFIVLGTAQSMWVALVGTAFAGACGSMAHVSRAIFMASHIPSGNLGKVYSLRNIVSTVASTVGTGLCGRLLGVWSGSRVIVTGGVLMVIMDIGVLLGLAVLMSAKHLHQHPCQHPKHHDHPRGQLPHREESEGSQCDGEISGRMDRAHPHRIVQSSRQDTYDGRIHPRQCSLKARASANGVPQRQCPHHQQKCRQKDGH